MQLSEIIDTAIAQAVGPSLPDRAVDINREFVRAMVNRGYREIERAALWKFSEAQTEQAAVVDQKTIPAPTDLALILGLRNKTLRTNLSYLDERQGAPDWGTDASPIKGRPEAYSYWQGEIRLWPIPNKADQIEIRYYKTWPELSASTDEPIIPETWQHLLIDYATARLILRMPAVDGRYLSESEARPYNEAFYSGLEQMAQSPLTLTVGDEITSHDYEAMLAEQEW